MALVPANEKNLEALNVVEDVHLWSGGFASLHGAEVTKELFVRLVVGNVIHIGSIG